MRRLFLTVGLASAVIVVSAGSATASTIYVNQTTDTVLGDANCSLREAVTAANTNAAFNGCTAGDSASMDTILLRATSYPRTIAPNADDDDNAGGDLDILTSGGPVTVQGLGNSGTTITGSSTSRVIDIIGDGQVNLTDIRTNSATVTASSGNPARGAGVRAMDGPNLTLTNYVAQSNTVTGTGAEITGAGVYQAGGTLTVRNSNFQSNTVSTASGAIDTGLVSGGGLFMEGGTLDVDAANFTSNTANPNFSLGATGAGDVGGAGMGLSNVDATLAHVSFVSNTASHQDTTHDTANPVMGGGLLVRPGTDLTVDQSSFTSNTVTTSNSAQSPRGGGIAVDDATAPVTIRNSNISSNTAGSGGTARQGAGLYWSDNSGDNDELRLDNVTMGGNTAQTTVSQGGAIYANDGNISAANLTIGSTNATTTTQNIALEGRSIYYVAGDGSFKIRSSSLSESTTAPGECGGPDKPTSLGYNIEGQTVDDCGFNGVGDQLGNPLMATLADNGMPQIVGSQFGSYVTTQTRLPGAGSPAIDAIPPASCLDSAGDPQTQDERGATRGGAYCDIGALEVDCALKGVTIFGTSGPDVIVGTPGDDVIDAGAGDDQVNGGGGDDTICGGQGADNIQGEGDDDTILPGSGVFNDTVDGGGGVNTLSAQDTTTTNTINLGAGTATGSGTDTISNFANVLGGTGTDTLTGDAGNNILDAGPQTNTAQTTTFDGREGDDTLVGQLKSNNGTATYANLNQAVVVDKPNGTVTGQGTDTLKYVDSFIGSPLDDTFIPGILPLTQTYNGGGGIDSISYAAVPQGPPGTTGFTAGTLGGTLTGPPEVGSVGTPGIENFTGTPNNDTITGDANSNVLDGGPGVDIVSFSGVATAVNANLATGIATGQGTDTIQNFENLTGSSLVDTLTGDDNDNVIDGRNGGDTINGAGGSDTADYHNGTGPITANLAAETATGTQGPDTLTNMENLIGTTGADSLTGDGDDNVIEGNTGNETVIDGAGGTDTLAFTLATGVVSANLAATPQNSTGAGTDSNISNMESFLGGTGNDTVISSPGDNRLDGGAGGVDTASYASALAGVTANLRTGLATGDGNDTLLNMDSLIGSPQDDTLIGDDGDNTLNGGLGTDRASFAGTTKPLNINLSAAAPQATGAGSDTLTAIEQVTAGDGNDTLRGTANADDLDGGPGSDTITFANTQPVSVDLRNDSSTSTADGTDALANIENVIGTPQNDTVVQDGADNNLDGAGGRDLLSYAGAPSADVDLGAGSATGDGTDTISNFEDLLGGSNDDALTGDGADNKITGGGGNDDIDGAAGSDRLIGGDGDDDFTGGDGVDLVDYSAVTDGVDANLGTGAGTGQGNDTYTTVENLLGGAGDDTLGSSAADNDLDGGSGGDDTVSYSAAAAGVSVNLRTQSASGDGNDTFAGIENATGSAHDDTLRGDPGDNTLKGGDGSDTVNFDAIAGPAEVDLGAGTSASDGNDTLEDIENVVGTAAADVFHGSDADNGFDGGSGGEDRVDYSTQNGPIAASLQTGTASGRGNDSFTGIEDLTGTAQDDTLEGGPGDNKLDGGDNTDPGDTLSFANTPANVDADIAPGAGHGVSKGYGNDTLANFENLTGSPQGDTLKGSDGDNAIDGLGGGDSIQAFDGDDTVDGDLGSDVIDAGSGENTVTGGPGADTITTGDDDDQINGDEGGDLIEAAAGDDVIDAGTGSDDVRAGLGADSLKLRDGSSDLADCGADTDADSVQSDGLDVDGLTNCDLTGDSVDALPSGQPPVETPPSGNQTPTSPKKKKTCPKKKKLKKGKCVKKKKKHKK